MTTPHAFVLRCAVRCSTLALLAMTGCVEDPDPDRGDRARGTPPPAIETAEPVAPKDPPLDAWRTLASGLVVREAAVGEGPTTGPTDTVEVALTLRVDGRDEAFLDRTLSFALDDPNLIRGLREGLSGVAVGTTRDLRIPPELAYREIGREPHVPPDATLLATATIVRIVP